MVGANQGTSTQLNHPIRVVQLGQTNLCRPSNMHSADTPDSTPSNTRQSMRILTRMHAPSGDGLTASWTGYAQ